MTESEIDQWCASLPDHVKMGPGHVVFDDGNYDMISWCTQKAIDAIRNNLDGTPDDFADFTIVELAETLQYLRMIALPVMTERDLSDYSNY